MIKPVHTPQSDPLHPEFFNQTSKIFSRDPVTLFVFAVFLVVTYVFYTTNFRNSLENFFFDFRAQVAASKKISDNVIIITVDEQSIEHLETDTLRRRVDGKGRPYLSVESLTRVASILANSDAAAVALLMPEFAFPANDLNMLELRDIVKYDRRFVIGTNGFNQPQPNNLQLPDVFHAIRDQVGGDETFRFRSTSVVRGLNYSSYQGITESEMLPAKIAQIFDPTFGVNDGIYELKFYPNSHFTTIAISDFLNQPLRWINQFKGKIIVVGYTVPRESGQQTAEQLLVNTALTGVAPGIDRGVSTTQLIANAIDNLVNHETLWSPPGIFVIGQTVIIAGLCGFAWELGSLVASIFTLFIWVVLLMVHSSLYRWFSLSIPLADTFLATVLVSIFAANRRLRLELMLMAENEATARMKAEIAIVQSNFLTDFSEWLQVMTEDVMSHMRQGQIQLANAGANHETNREIFRRAFAAGEDFEEYLRAIRQIPEIESIANHRQRFEEVNLESLIQTILRRFEIKMGERNIKVWIDISSESETVKTIPQILDAILFNLISNAIKYGPDDAPIEITARTNRDKELVIAVTDRGPGIPNELAGRIFERFYRIRDERLYKAKGTGLGLYLCKYFAEALGGRIELTSETNHERGTGSTFSVVLP